MTSTIHTRRAARRRLAAAGLATAAILALTGAARAGECPSDKVVADGQRAGANTPKGVTDTVLGSTDLTAYDIGIDDRLFRMRRLDIQPGGEVAWHSHENRPALIYVVSGEITEFASTCSAPIVHRAGEISVEAKATSHWWKNSSSQPVVLISADLFPKEGASDDMM
jgi:quercetin dioxygenase-like cupin family protein